MPCQDRANRLEFGNIQAIAVADGHGSADCFRSEIGSRFAVYIALRLLRDACKDFTDTFSDTGIKNFKYRLWQEWRGAVRRHWNLRLKHDKTLGENEPRYETVSDKYKSRYTSDDPAVVEKYLCVAYGSTLLCAVSIGTQILMLQIGDGTCAVLRRDGSFSTPMPEDADIFSNVTSSLCEENADLKIRHVILDCEGELAPIAIFLSSDGLDNCFYYDQNEEHLYKFYADVLLDNIIRCGFEETEREAVDSLLPEMTARGSRDDISLAYMIADDLELLKAVHEQIADEYKSEPQSEEEVPIIDEQPATFRADDQSADRKQTDRE